MRIIGLSDMSLKTSFRVAAGIAYEKALAAKSLSAKPRSEFSALSPVMMVDARKRENCSGGNKKANILLTNTRCAEFWAQTYVLLSDRSSRL
jgi:hypothetical protein